jgi:hypothetical protein
MSPSLSQADGFSLLRCNGSTEIKKFDRVLYPNLAKMSEVIFWRSVNFGMDIYAAYRLDDILKNCGFEHVSKSQFTLGYGAKAKDPNLKAWSAITWVELLRGLGSNLPTGGIPGVARTLEEFSHFLEDLRLEVLEYGFAPKVKFVVGQKPLP